MTIRRGLCITMLLIVPLIGCDYDVPITTEPTRKVDATLLGDWISDESSNNLCRDQLKVRKYDESTYVVTYNGELYRAWHSDVGNAPFLTVQELDSPDRKYSYMSWSLSEGMFGQQLSLHSVNAEIVSNETRDSAAVAKLLQANAENKALLGLPNRFTRKR